MSLTYDENNIYPNNLERILFHRTDTIVKSLAKQANSICRNLISEEYIRSTFNKFNYGFCYKNSDNIIGFCLWKEIHEDVQHNKYKYIKLLLICAKPNDFRLGEIILFDLNNFCIQRRINTIRLLAANLDLVKYYENNGYFLTRQNEPYFMEKDTVPLKIRNSNVIKTRKAKRVYGTIR